MCVPFFTQSDHTQYFHILDGKSIKSAAGSSTDLMSPPKMKGEEQAYIPYKFARDTIVRIVNDMHKMKGNHVSVIGQIESNYKMIEDQTQVCDYRYRFDCRHIHELIVVQYKK